MNRFLSCVALAAAFSLPTIVRADTFVNLALDGYANEPLSFPNLFDTSPVSSPST